MKSLYKNPFFYLSLILALAVGFQAYGIVSAQTIYTAPTTAPTGGMPYRLLNEGPTAQTKTGNLTVGGICLPEKTSSPGQDLQCKLGWDTIGIGWSAGLNNAIYRLTGNVGIGTTGPGAPLQVVYPYSRVDTTLRDALWLSSNDANNYHYLKIQAMGHASTQVSRYYSFQTGNGAAPNSGIISLQPSGGNVGIGTTDPKGKLHVTGGDLRLDSNDILFKADDTGDIVFQNPDNTEKARIYAGVGKDVNTINIRTAGSDRLTINEGGDVSITSLAVTGGARCVRVVDKKGTLSLASDDCGTGGGGTSQWVGTSDIYYNGGNVGIGTPGPAQKLHVEGNVRAGGTTPMGISTEANELINLDANFRLKVNDTLRGGAFRIDTRTGQNLFQVLSRVAGSATENTLMVIQEGGNVGIGTSTPSQKLEVAALAGQNNSVGIALTNSDFGRRYVMYTSRNSGGGWIGNNSFEIFEYDKTGCVTGGGGICYGRFALLPSTSGNPGAAVFPIGNVGIGTTNPKTKLTVTGGTAVDSGFGVISGDVWTVIRNYPTSNNAAIDVTAQGNETTIGTVGYNLLLNPSGGNVGIGTASPQSKLHVSGGNVEVQNGNLMFKSDYANPPYIATSRTINSGSIPLGSYFYVGTYETLFGETTYVRGSPGQSDGPVECSNTASTFSCTLDVKYDGNPLVKKINLYRKTGLGGIYQLAGSVDTVNSQTSYAITDNNVSVNSNKVAPKLDTTTAGIYVNGTSEENKKIQFTSDGKIYIKVGTTALAPLQVMYLSPTAAPASIGEGYYSYAVYAP